MMTSTEGGGEALVRWCRRKGEGSLCQYEAVGWAEGRWASSEAAGFAMGSWTINIFASARRFHAGELARIFCDSVVGFFKARGLYVTQ